VAIQTFDNDLGLDFKEPYFKDAQYLFNHAKQSRKIIIGNPTLEISTHQYKIYSHSYLNDNSFLQLGFTDPELPLYFKQAIKSIESHPNIQYAELYIQYDNLQVSPLSITNTMRAIDKETLDKMSYLKAVQEQTIKDTALFNDLDNNQMIVHKNNNREETYNMYLSLSKLAFVEDIHANIICKVTFEKQQP